MASTQNDERFAVKFNADGEVIGLEGANVRGQKVRITPVQSQFRIEIQNRHNNDYHFLAYADNLYELKKEISAANLC